MVVDVDNDAVPSSAALGDLTAHLAILFGGDAAASPLTCFSVAPSTASLAAFAHFRGVLDPEDARSPVASPGTARSPAGAGATEGLPQPFFLTAPSAGAGSFTSSLASAFCSVAAGTSASAFLSARLTPAAFLPQALGAIVQNKDLRNFLAIELSPPTTCKITSTEAIRYAR
jgi:hypothetical protein